MERRKFLKATSLLTAAGFFSTRFPLIAGPFNKEDFFNSYFPSDKKLDAAWLNSLYERGEVTTYSKSKNELRYIGMPVGGICAGCVYLGGDGRLWLWDIFNQNQFGVVTKILPIKLDSFGMKEIKNSEGTLYLEPLTQASPFQQGFALVITHNGKTVTKRLQQEDWDEVLFEATYPIATVKYMDNNLPLEISLKAFSPFIPGNDLDSGLPATIQSISIKNTSSSNIKIEVVGWMENKTLLYAEKTHKDFTRENVVLNSKSCKGVTLGYRTDNKALDKEADAGNMFLAAINQNAKCVADVSKAEGKWAGVFKKLVKPVDGSPIAGVYSTHNLSPNKTITADFAITWYMPNLSFYSKGNPQGMTVQGAETQYYSTHFSSAQAVAEYIAGKYDTLKHQTVLWQETWYASTLPHWFLERTFSNISTLATTTSHRFQSGRFYAWEGVGCCHGTCTHVYQYAHAMSRVFPELERDMRERVDLGISFDPKTGSIAIRGEQTGPSIDGHAGTILRIYREHQMSGDDSFLKKNWSKIKQAVIFLMAQDKNNDGMEDTPMENTLDALWSGEIAWIVGLCIAGVRAGQAMAEEMNDTDFAKKCAQYVELGKKNMEQYLFNGEYFIHRPDPNVEKKEIGSFNTCHIDQVYGQSWAWQVGLDRVIGKEKTMSALRALWKYNYMPDVGPYIKVHKDGRFYALAGEGGMVMNTNPRNDENPYGNAKAWQVGYFSECMSGFEHQVAAHMMAEGMVEEALVLTRSIHDRYHAAKRNPFNEIECSDHYGRAMASYGTFITACGFTYHGPKGHIGFSPKIAPDNFKAPFTAAEGWGTYSQQRTSTTFNGSLAVAHGKLKVRKVSVDLEQGHKAGNATLTLNGKTIACNITQTDTRCEITINEPQVINENQSLVLQIS